MEAGANSSASGSVSIIKRLSDLWKADLLMAQLEGQTSSLIPREVERALALGFCEDEAAVAAVNDWAVDDRLGSVGGLKV